MPQVLASCDCNCVFAYVSSAGLIRLVDGLPVRDGKVFVGGKTHLSFDYQAKPEVEDGMVMRAAIRRVPREGAEPPFSKPFVDHVPVLTDSESTTLLFLVDADRPIAMPRETTLHCVAFGREGTSACFEVNGQGFTFDVGGTTFAVRRIGPIVEIEKFVDPRARRPEVRHKGKTLKDGGLQASLSRKARKRAESAKIRQALQGAAGSSQKGKGKGKGK